MTGFKLTTDAKERIQTMVRTNNGFEIAEADLKLRGPGDLEGTQQSGILNLHIADLAKDGKILEIARNDAQRILDEDSPLLLPEHQSLRVHIEQNPQNLAGWSRIS